MKPRRRGQEPTVIAGALVELGDGAGWRAVVHPDADLERLAERLYRAAGWTCAASPLDPSTIRPPSGPTAVSIDTIDAWLAQADANDGGRRRDWCWRQALDVTIRPTS